MRDVHVERSTEHMLGWCQRIATRTSVESPSGCGSWKKDDVMTCYKTIRRNCWECPG